LRHELRVDHGSKWGFLGFKRLSLGRLRLLMLESVKRHINIIARFAVLTDIISIYIQKG
jgi:hypothetical protein